MLIYEKPSGGEIYNLRLILFRLTREAQVQKILPRCTLI